MKALQKLFTIFVALSMSACFNSEPSDLPEGCSIKDDQKTLFFGRWNNHPIPLAVEVNDFNESDLKLIETAIQTWNTFAASERKITLFSNQGQPLQKVPPSTARITRSNVCNRFISTESGFSDSIRIYKTSSAWPYGSQVIALTSFCPMISSNPYFHEIKSALLEINYENFFSPGNPNPDLQTTVLHELGHILGLDHSCKQDQCTNAPTDYVSAVMYPSFMESGSTGYAKRILKSNDKIRASCLY